MEDLVNNPDVFAGAYRRKRVLVTGHTGFKGSWLCLWLSKLGADVAGFSLYLPSSPCNFEVINLRKIITHREGDVGNIEKLKKVFEDFRPQVVFHLAAQPIVRQSYNEPKLTFDTNLGGTVNVLECVRTYCHFVQAAVIITSDKCYQNVEWDWGYRESDQLGGDDPYSASKACAELACKAYIKSYFNGKNEPKVATTRAGNVIGGGDWAKDRIIPDCVKAWSRQEKPIIRNPEATRPWQHVLEPLSGYLWLGVNLIKNTENVAGEAFNFGPDGKIVKPVHELINLFLRFWGESEWEHVPTGPEKKESTYLKLCCDKALHRLRWHSILDFEEAVELTAEWFKNYYGKQVDMCEFSCSQIKGYTEKAIKQKMSWAIKET